MKKTFTTRLLAVVICIAMLATVTPIFAAAETTITEITITDADVTPYIGEKAGDWLDYTLPENCHFTMARHYWYNETTGSSMKADEVFAAGSRYDLYWRCEPESGYTFDAGTTVTINGKTDIVDTVWTVIDDEDDTVFYVWTKSTEAVEKTAANVIDKIEITNADVTPYIGGKAGDWLDYTLPENRHFTVNGHYWYNETAKRNMTSEDVFAAGLEYDLCWVFKADSGYTFSAGTTVTINGQTDIVDPKYTEIDGEDNTTFYVWTKSTEAVEKPAANVITKIKITNADVTPYIGEKAGDWSDYTLPANCHYTAEREYWHREGTDGGEVLSDDVFEEGVRYDRYWYFKADEGYIFDENAVITINGSTALVDTSFSRYYENAFSVWTKPTEAVENTVITKIEISDVDSLPVIGEKANDHIDYTFSENCHFTAAKHGWYDMTDGTWVESADDTFVAGHIYQVGWWLDADEGYTFAKDPTITINGGENINWEYTYIDENNSMRFFVWSEPREAVELTVIDKIEINGFCDPVVGGKASDFIHLTLPEDAPYHIEENSPCWEHNNGAFLEDDDVFEAGKSYTLGCTLIADAGYIFAEDAGVFLNGGDVGVDEKFTKIDSEDAGIFYVWSEPKEAVEPTVIDKIEINGFCDPVVGGKAGDFIHLTLPEDAPYYFDYSLWYNDTDEYDLSSGDTFEAGKFYSLGGGLIADAGYIFAEDAEVLLNGGDVGVDEKFTKIDSEDAGIFYVWSESREAVEPTEKLLGDANDDGAVNMKDVLALRKQLAGMDVTYNAANADADGNGKIDMKDVLMLRKYLAGLITELGT